MKKLVLLFAVILTGLFSSAQQTYSYENYFNYRHFLYLNTPSVLLSAAGFKAIAGDTAEAIKLVQRAVSKKLYDTGYVTNNSRIKFVTLTNQWSLIKSDILKNEKAFSDPGNMEINTGDLDNFWKVFDNIDKPGIDKMVMDDYIMKGSQGLRTFFELRMGLRSTAIIENIRRHRKYFESIRPVIQQLYTYNPHIKSAAKKLKELYPKSIFPPTTFCIGTFGAFGTADGGSGQLIGAEFLCDTNSVVTGELSGWEKSVIADTSRILGICIHELVHVQQQTRAPKTLLEKSIFEGTADFITSLVLGYNLNSRLHEYGKANEKVLREKFKSQMNSEDLSEWLYNGNDAKREVPADLGYFIGFRICELYYNKAPDKKQAIEEILTIQDFKKFLEQSGY